MTFVLAKDVLWCLCNDRFFVPFLTNWLVSQGELPYEDVEQLLHINKGMKLK